VGAQESQRLHQVRIQLATLLPQIAAIHPGAATELRNVDLHAAPALAALVERLAILNRVESELAGTRSQETAHDSAVELRRRLEQGVEKYEELLHAALQLVSAPDPYQATAEMLDSSARELTAYAHGLQVAAPSAPPN
jgi:hypothetical protein